MHRLPSASPALLRRPPSPLLSSPLLSSPLRLCRVARNDEQKEPTTSSHLTLLNSASHIIHRHLFHSRSEQALQRLTTAAAPAAVAAPARPPSLPSIPLSLPNITTLLPIPSNDPSYPLRAHFLSCHSHPSPPSYPRTLTPQALPVVLRTDPKLLTLCHLFMHQVSSD